MERNRKQPVGLAAFINQAPLILTLIAAGLVFLMIMAFKGCSKKPDEAPDFVPGAATEEATKPDAPTDSADLIPTESGELTPTDAPATDAPETEAPTEAPTEPAVKTYTTVDDSYFDDVLFIGDSRTDGLCLYSPMGNARHYSSQSMTIYKIMETTDAAYGYNGLRALLKGEKFGKIYLMLGINEVGYATDSFASKYKEVVDEIRAAQPDALIYLQSILYVTQKHEKNYPVFATAGIKEKNEKIKALANGTDIFYLEVNDCLNDGTDHLPSEYTGDGAHLKAKYYSLWHNYLLEHAIVDAAHPWPKQTETPESTE